MTQRSKSNFPGVERQELERVQRKCAALKREIKALRVATTLVRTRSSGRMS